MDRVKSKKSIVYSFLFIILLAVEVLIALFVKDRFIRPYGGDILVTLLLCCFFRIFFTDKIKLLPLWVFVFAAAVEISQYFHFVELIGLQEILFFKVLLGNTFSFADLICYAAGCVLFYVCDRVIFKAVKS